MDASVTAWIRTVDFQRSFLALSYFFGGRGESLGEPLSGFSLANASAELLERLRHPERSERAKALAGELGRLSTALDERGLWR